MGQGGLKERESTRSLVERAKKHEIAGEFVEAAECYQQLIKRDPGDPSLFAALAGAVMRQGRLNDARAAFERAIELNPEQPAWVYQNLGNVYSELQAPDRALSVYQIALQRNKERNAELLYLGIGRSLRRLQRWTDASLAYQQAIEVRETTGGRSYGEDVYLELREALLREGNAASAARAYQHWLEQSYLINHTHQVIYCPIPKNACTFFKTVLVENSERRDEFKKSKKDAHVFTRQKDSGFRLTDVRYLERSDYCKFVILRNPFDRLVSAYANLFVQPLRQQQRVERIVQDVIKAIYVFEGAEPDFVKSVSFDQFVRYLIRTEDVDLNYHWRPQHTLLGYGLVNFDLIGQFENLSSVMQRLATKTGMRIQNRILNRTVYGSPVGSDSYHDLHPREFLKLEEFPRAQELVTSELAELIKDRYAKDIEIYKTAFDSDPSTSFSASRNVQAGASNRPVNGISQTERTKEGNGGIKAMSRMRVWKYKFGERRTLTTETLAIDGGQPLRRKPFGPRWLFGDEERRQVLQVIDQAPTSWRSRFKVREFAQAFAKTYGVRHAIATSTGTGAVHAAVAAIDPDPGDEIITTPVTAVGTVIGILLQNAIPVFADWDAKSFNTDPADIERKITERTRAILVVHLFGNPCDMGAIMEIARARDLPVIEDCAQAHLAEYRGRKVGTIGNIACFSLGQKTLTTDQGGFVLTNDSVLAKRVEVFLGKGCEGGKPRHKHRFASLGSFYPMTDLQAAVGLAQLQRLEEATRVRERTAAILDETFSQLPGFMRPQVHSEDRHSYYVYPFAIDPELAGVSLERFVSAVQAEGIPDASGPYLDGLPLYRYPLFSEDRTYGRSGYPFLDEQGQRRADYRTLHLPNAERLLPNVGFFHLRNSLTEQEARDMAAAVRKVAMYYARQQTVTPKADGSYQKLGDKLFQEGRYREAANNYQEAVRSDDSSAGAYFALGKALQHLNQIPEAIAAYRNSIHRNPHLGEVYHWLGSALSKQGEFDEAAACYEKAIEINPKGAHYYRGLGHTRKKQGRIDEGIALLRQSLKLNPRYALAYVQLGDILTKQGNLSEAAACYRQAVKLEPSNAHSYRKLDSVQLKQEDEKKAATNYLKAVARNPQL